jgi:hypothetical protein
MVGSNFTSVALYFILGLPHALMLSLLNETRLTRRIDILMAGSNFTSVCGSLFYSPMSSVVFLLEDDWNEMIVVS